MILDLGCEVSASFSPSTGRAATTARARRRGNLTRGAASTNRRVTNPALTTETTMTNRRGESSQKTYSNCKFHCNSPFPFAPSPAVTEG